MAEVSFRGVKKVYDKDVVAVSDLDLDVADGELLVVVGPSGCGKTTTLRMLAGLEDITSGEISIGGKVVNDLTAKERDIAMVFQSYALYPHLTVAENLAYPLRMAKMPKQQRSERVTTVSKQLRLEELLDRKPRQLSGGQRQRVAMGRAMVREPQVFLMDEPLSNLDAKLRVLMRSEVAELQQLLNTTMFYVTHDQIEAMTMGHRVAIMDRGVLQQVAPPAELYRKPANLFVAGFIGSPPMNLINATVEHGLNGGSGSVTLRSGSAAIELASGGGDAIEGANGRLLVVGIRPEHVRLSEPSQGARATVKLIEMLGSESLVHLDVDGFDYRMTENENAEEVVTTGGRVLCKLHDQAAIPRQGDNVGVVFDRDRLHLFDPEDGSVITADPSPAGAKLSSPHRPA